MDIFKKTIKYSKPSIEIDNKIKDLNEGLKKTKSTLSEQKFSEEEVDKLLSEHIVDVENWKEIFDENTVSEYEKQIDEIRDRHNDLIKVQGSIEHVKNKEVKEIFSELYQGEVERVVDTYVSKYSNDIINLREDLFHEIKKEPVVDLRVLEEKINLLTLKYNQLSEGLLNEPSTGLEESVTFEHLKNHYQLLVGRLQEQLATLGGGGEVRLQYLDDIVGIATNAASYDGKFLKYNHSLKKFEFVTVTGGSGIGLTDLSVTTNSAGTAALSYNNNGVFTYTPPSFVGYATEGYVDNAVVGFITSGSLTGYATEGYVNNAVAGVSTFSGDYNDLTNKPINVSDFTNDTGFITTSFTNTSQLTNDAGFITNNVSGVVTATTFVGALTGNATSADTIDVTAASNSANYFVTFVDQAGAGRSLRGDSGIIYNPSSNNLAVSGAFSATDVTATGDFDVDGHTNLDNVSIAGVTTANTVTIKGPFGNNVIIGQSAGANWSGAQQCVAIGYNALQANTNSNFNTAVGVQALAALGSNSGSNYASNTAVGHLAGSQMTTSSRNTLIGRLAGSTINSNNNTILGIFDGNQGGLDIRNSSNNVVIADGASNIRLHINASGNAGIGTTNPDAAVLSSNTKSLAVGILTAYKLYGIGSNLTGLTGASAGTYGNATNSAQITVDSNGRITGITQTGISGGGGGGISGINIFNSGTSVGLTTNLEFRNNITAVSSGSTIYVDASGISTANINADTLNVSGIATATSFSGSGIGLTSIPAGQLTGNLPAIDGSALLNVNASRTTVSASTGSIANNAVGLVTVTGFKSYALMKVGLSTEGWIRIYTDSASRTADSSRSVGIDPAPGSGVIAEVVTTGISTEQKISPFTMGGNMDDPVDTTIYMSITNLSGSTQSINANLTILQLEA